MASSARKPKESKESAKPDFDEFLGAELDDQVIVQEAQRRGYIVTRDAPQLHRQVKLDAPKRGKIRIAVASDTHLGNKHQQLTHWRAFMETATEWKADLALHGGDVVDGTNMHRDQQYELFKHGSDAQGVYAVNNWPELKSSRGKTLDWYTIGGNHDGAHWNNAGANVLRQISDSRDDIHVLGAPTGTFHISGLKIDLVHPDGGVPYARSYRPQKIVEQMPPDTKPHILLIGHYHVPVHVPGYRNVEALMLPCFESQTAYLRRKQLSPVIGGVLLEVEFSEKGMEDFTVKWITYRTPIPNDHP